jgi:hypothetical protein
MSLSFPPISSGNSGQTLPPISSFIQQLLDDPDGATARRTLGLDGSIGYDVILLAGQSNMVGWSGGGVNSAIDTTDPRIRCWPGTGPNLGQIILAADPLPHRELRGINDIGLGMTFAREYVKTIPFNRSVLLVCAALGGTGFIGNRWNPGNDLHSWAVSAVNQVLGLDPSNKFVAILWHQGEADVGNSNYQSQLDAGLTAFRAQITGAANVPIITGDFVEAWVGTESDRIATQNIIRQTNIRLPGIAHASATGTTGPIGDPLHFSAADCRVMGKRYYVAYQSLLVSDPPPAPTGLTLTSIQSNSIILSWAGALGATDYIVQTRVGTAQWITVADGVSPASSAIITGLESNTQYRIQVAATNVFGQGNFSQELITQTPLANAVPNAPTGLTSTVGDTTITLSWTAPINKGGTPLNDYIVQWSLSGASNWTTFPDNTSTNITTTITGLTANTAYDIRVAAVNSNGAGIYSTIHPATTSSTTILANYIFNFPLLGNTNEISGNGATLTALGTLGFISDAIRGQVLDITSNGYYVVANGGLPNSYSKLIWFRWTAINGASNYNLISGVSTNSHYFWITNDGYGPAGSIPQQTLRAGHGNGVQNLVAHTTALSENTWYHGAVTYNSTSTTMRLYLNGQPVATNINAQSIGLINNTKIGTYADNDFNNRFNGQLQQAKLLNIALSESQILSIYNAEAI